MNQLSLLDWKPPRQVIPFPARLRTGHAEHIARLLAKAKTTKQADAHLARAITSFQKQLSKAGVDDDEIGRQQAVFVRLIHAACLRVGSKWAPTLETEQQGGGAA